MASRAVVQAGESSQVDWTELRADARDVEAAAGMVGRVV
jgi:hypothetical protein